MLHTKLTTQNVFKMRFLMHATVLVPTPQTKLIANLLMFQVYVQAKISQIVQLGPTRLMITLTEHTSAKT